MAAEIEKLIERDERKVQPPKFRSIAEMDNEELCALANDLLAIARGEKLKTILARRAALRALSHKGASND